ncbi:MAG: hypothetical protein IJ628_01660 [Bacteroidaceae bacterium]|nr:hypothetical protein [Bacteroidaceae bacterium]
MKKTKMRKEKSVKNARSVEIRKCCASCEHMSYDCDGRRMCKVLKRARKQKAVCTLWMMRQVLQKAGNSGGLVKTRHYLLYAMKVRLREEKAVSAGLITEQQRLSVEEIRSQYVAKFNRSIYFLR